MPGEIFLHVIRDKVMLIGKAEVLCAAESANFCPCLTMRLEVPATSGIPFPIRVVGNDHLWFPIVALFGGIERIEKLLHVLAVDFLDIEAISAKPRRRCLRSGVSFAIASSVTAFES